MTVLSRCAVVHHLVGTAEIATMLGVSRQRVHQLARRADFPAPEAVLSAGAIWRREAIEQWIERTGRAGTDDP